MQEVPESFRKLHEQVALQQDQKDSDFNEKQAGITEMRKNLVGQAEGLVLETCIGNNKNNQFYDESKVKKIIGVDWVLTQIELGETRYANQHLFMMAEGDCCELPFESESFDTVVDTFGLECT